ncbi:MAG: hypothetical protein R3D70_12240 [Rhizobiaceae bacterium]
MATIGDLVRMIAQAEGIDEVSVDVYARRAREAGFISQGGRGRSAPKMTVRDAANLLIAVNASPTGREVHRIVPYFRELELAGSNYTTAFFDEAEHYSGVVIHATTASSFGEALEILIEGAAEGTSLQDDLFGGKTPVTDSKLRRDFETVEQKMGAVNKPVLNVSFNQKARGVRIAFLNEEVSHDPVIAEAQWTGPAPASDGDQEVTITISDKTIVAVANLINGDNEFVE